MKVPICHLCHTALYWSMGLGLWTCHEGHTVSEAGLQARLTGAEALKLARAPIAIQTAPGRVWAGNAACRTTLFEGSTRDEGGRLMRSLRPVRWSDIL